MKKNILTLTIAALCLSAGTFAQTQKGSLNYVNTLNYDAPKCSSGNDGWIHLELDPLGGPYHVQWSNGMTTPYIDNLTAGVYTAVVTDNQGNITFETVTLTDPLPIVITPVITEPTSTTSLDGAIMISVANAASAYDFHWSTSDGSGLTGTSLNQAHLGIGNYKLDLQTTAGCRVSASYSLSSNNNTSAGSVNTPTSVNDLASPVGTHITWVHSQINGTVKLRAGLNSNKIEIYRQDGSQVRTNQIEAGTEDVQELELENGYYIAVFYYTDGTVDRQMFMVQH